MKYLILVLMFLSFIFYPLTAETYISGKESSLKYLKDPYGAKAANKPGSFYGLYPFISYPIKKIRPKEKPLESSKINIKIAGNEYESAVFGIFNKSKTPLRITGISVKAHLLGPLSFKIYSVAYIEIKKASRWFDPFNKKGRWPDPLLPISRLSIFHETVPPKENRTWLIDFYRLFNNRRNNRTGVFFVTLNLVDTENITFKFVIKPLPFNLPKKSSYATAFGFSASLVRNKHEELSSLPFNSKKLETDYLHLLARHRISVYYPMDKRIPLERSKKGSIRFNWSQFDAVTGALLDGKVFKDAPSQTSFRTPIPPKGLSRSELETFYRELGKHLKEKGWLNRVFYYLPDEPLRRQYPEVRSIALFIKKAYPGIRTLVTEPFTKKLAGVIDIWCPDIPSIGDSVPFLPAFFKGSKLVADWQWNPYPSVYLKRQKLGETAWFYTCMSAQYLDYPNLFIDVSAMYNRIIPWLSYRYGFTGLLYYQTVYDYAKDRNPWESEYQFYCNGDGNLLYPGTPEILHSYGIGDGKRPHVPCPSIRFKLLREGIEDYEYLKILERRSGRENALRYAKELATGSISWKRSVGELKAVREKIITEITGAMAVK
ncbi:MAG: DUF4091 domain-containing protein [Spirochaetales bacterium]|nr:DUF4091 domain-containing protein [Spirochaetales bacterium]